MRWTVCGGGMVILALASCASPAPKPAATEMKSLVQGIILTMRPVRDPAGNAEYVVRTDDGSTVAIVQAADPALRPGVSVAIGQGERATLAAR